MASSGEDETDANRSADDDSMFREAFSDIVPIEQDKIPPPRKMSKQKSTVLQKNSAFNKEQNQLRQAAASFHFSDGFEAHFDMNGPLKYVKPGADSHEVKRLRRGEYPPDLILDLHGYKRDDAKLEIAALIETARKEHIHCVCIVHGIGSFVLKKTVPNWLVQHPSVLGFHQAPLEWGGQGALLVLIEQQQNLGKF
ncbi:endonuclease SmrB [Aestuariibacter sp. AA17]|uniref:Ribosome rescue factor SmrB n=1 Tax=Fluctibacter corallii TaxID=2984329 RepID=A0ABT3A387_9ALTE|nr:endonuclease SmrB [Aestuariibacter sp. AA17]MCV2883099.1 endonuclease SmrB [Aestuariibacter sp. AA17]